MRTYIERIFISYAREDQEIAEQVYQRISKAGFNVWMDTKNILPGEKWELSTQSALLESHLILVLLSSRSINKRGFFQKEIKEALEVCQKLLDSDIYLIPVRLEECEVPAKLREFQWVDYFKDNSWLLLEKTIRASIKQRRVADARPLRSVPAKLYEADVKKMLQKRDFFDRNWYWMGKGIRHTYELVQTSENKLTVDYATGLLWQQSGSRKALSFQSAKKFVVEMCHFNFGGFSDWRLPTLEEAMSLIEPSRKNGDLYLDPVFDKKQTRVWTADEGSDFYSWIVSFYHGTCIYHDFPYNFVRVVRNGDIPHENYSN